MLGKQWCSVYEVQRSRMPDIDPQLAFFMIKPASYLDIPSQPRVIRAVFKPFEIIVGNADGKPSAQINPGRITTTVHTDDAALDALEAPVAQAQLRGIYCIELRFAPYPARRRFRGLFCVQVTIQEAGVGRDCYSPAQPFAKKFSGDIFTAG